MWIGIGALAKGPVAWIFVAFALLVWRLLPQSLRFAPRRGAHAWIGLVVLAILPVAVWAALAIHEEQALLKPLLFGQHIGRITEANKHAGPVWNHLVSMPLLLLPWTFLLVAGLVRAWRSWRAREDAGLVRVAAWFAVVFVFFSLIPPKRDLYLLPIYSAAAMIGARELVVALRARKLPGWIGWSTGIALLIIGLTLTLAPVVVPILLEHAPSNLGEIADDAREQASLVVPVGIVMLLAAVAALIGQRLRSPRTWANALAIGMATSITTAAIVVVPAIDGVKSARAIAEILRARPERPSRIACAGVRPEGIRFYGGGPASAEPLVPALEREGDQFLGLVIDKEWDRLSAEDRARFRAIGEARLGRHAVHVLGKAGP
jgi:4-amino-4-deoxy-L-arabinose transferase-like glycosyltransferase